MTPREIIRLRCLALARPEGLSNPDAAQIVARAKLFEEYVSAEEPVRETRATGKKPTGAAKPQEHGPG